jgi:hypothetical protein
MAKRKCKVKQCGRIVLASRLCSRHYHRWHKYGDPNNAGNRSPNKIITRNGVVRIQLTRRDGTVLWAKADARDWGGLKLAQYRWHVKWEAHCKTFYVKTSKRPYSIHRFILKTRKPVIDHIDFNGLNNRRKNLRPATHSESIRHRRRRPAASVVNILLARSGKKGDAVSQ